MPQLKLWSNRRNHNVIIKISRNVLPAIESVTLSLQKMSNHELMLASEQLRIEVNQGGAATQLRLRAFAFVKEAVLRAIGLEMYDVQLIGGWVLCEGSVAEMKTGEGKTIVSYLPAYWFALQGKGVHLITVNEYLARRDYEQMTKVFSLLGLTVGINLANMPPSQKKTAYQQDITFGTSSEFGFDYLRDHLTYDLESRVQRSGKYDEKSKASNGLAYAIIDEIDSILIDEARTPLIIAGKTKAAPDLYYICARFVQGLQEDRDYEVDSETRQVMFTESAIRRIEMVFQIDNLYDLEHTSVYHHLLQSLRAKVLYRQDVDYIILDGRIELIDAFTGRIMEGRQYGEGLHQAIEAKEKVPLSEEIRKHAVITVQKYFSLYGQVVGMTGTVKSEEEEIRRIYGLDVVVIPTYKPIVRVDERDRIFLTRQEKYTYVIEEIKRRHDTGQPVLVGTTSVRQSEEISLKLAEAGVSFRLLNAKTEEEEAQIVAVAGERGAVTIATNIAGRGTDIRLSEGVAELGGLYVIGTEHHESRRIDMQLRGRAGRQGDPGSSQFLLSLEDELLERFAGEEVEELRSAWQDSGFRINKIKLQTFTEQVQHKVEQMMFSLRSMVYQLDSVIHEQRQAFYAQRNAIVDKEVDMREILSEHLDFNEKESIEHRMKDQGWFEPLRIQWIQIMDLQWQDHLDWIELVKQGMHYQSYAQTDPILAYEKVTWTRFARMDRRIKRSVERMLADAVAQGIMDTETHDAESAQILQQHAIEHGRDREQIRQIRQIS